ncbi:cytochrome P450 [Sphingorhabdus sp.]|jgi:cytochrome P450|uniref:cytochrome P450 n=1 Tax=Sphingorhabdus sp. TaxID=1902408 RepID=UPI0037CBB1F8
MPAQTLDGAIPLHVPPELVRDIDYFAILGVEADPYTAWLQALDGGPRMIYTPRNGGHWIVWTFDDIRAVLRDYEKFSSYPPAIPRTLVQGPYPQPPVGADPPEHTPFREMLQPAFTPRAIVGMEKHIRQLTNELIDNFIDSGHCEFVGDFAQRMPIGVFLGLMGLPDSDREQLLECAHQRMRGATEADRIGGAMALGAYADLKLRERRGNPQDDLLSRIANYEINGKLTDFDQLRTLVVTLLLAGLDTVVNTLSFVTRWLAEAPERRAELASILNDDQKVMRATEELLRRFSVPCIARAVRDDMEFNGVQMQAGDPVLSIISMAGLDSSKYVDPMVVDFDRDPGLQVNFGAGVHRCIGMHLARMEIRIFLEEWMRRIPEFHLVEGNPPVGIGGAVLGLGTLPLAWPASA